MILRKPLEAMNPSRPEVFCSTAPAPVLSLSPLVKIGPDPKSSPGGCGPGSPDGPDSPLRGS
eukprot:7427571-Alexandrium_andersonii.AAC.1